MRTRLATPGFAGVAAVIFAASAHAHHSVSTNYFSYEEAPVELVGTITCANGVYAVERRPCGRIVYGTLDSIRSVSESATGNACRRCCA